VNDTNPGHKRWHFDIRPDTTPHQAGLEHLCKLHAPDEFLGRATVERQELNGANRRLIGFQIEEEYDSRDNHFHVTLR
jgi:aminomethyltransferase